MYFCGRNGHVEFDMCFHARTRLVGRGNNGKGRVRIAIIAQTARCIYHANLRIELDPLVSYVIYRSKSTLRARWSDEKWTSTVKIHIKLLPRFRMQIYISNSTLSFDRKIHIKIDISDPFKPISGLGDGL